MTRRKILFILDTIERRGIKVFFPRAGLVEVASVLRRCGVERGMVLQVIERIDRTFVVVEESFIYDKALEVALITAPSGFDTYFIALALLTNSLLITDDRDMAYHAKKLNLKTILVREASIEELRAALECV